MSETQRLLSNWHSSCHHGSYQEPQVSLSQSLYLGPNRINCLLCWHLDLEQMYTEQPFG